MGVTVFIDRNKINKRFFDNDRLKKQVSQLIINGIEQYVPYRTGKTWKSGMSYPGYITFSTSYVRYIYFKPMNFRTTFHKYPTNYWVTEGFEQEKGNIMASIQKEFDNV